MPGKCNRWPPEAWEEVGHCNYLGMTDFPRHTPLVLLPEGEGAFQTAEQVQHVLDQTFLPETVELDVIPGEGYGWSQEPKTVKCAVMYNTYNVEVFEISEHAVVYVNFRGKPCAAAVAFKITKKLDKNGRALTRSKRDKEYDRECRDCEERHPEYYAMDIGNRGVPERLAYLRREAAKLRIARGEPEPGDEDMDLTESGQAKDCASPTQDKV
ncbi:hypothetical protein SEPCBS57363_001859 [Sporothrix epigloea]|uniref:Uncharacterized protein n=1 Tax=Sporothrix epigloea TaxID=1892477 RepID=A0ABP0DCM2_9PEZI